MEGGERETSTNDADIRVLEKCRVVSLLDWLVSYLLGMIWELGVEGGVCGRKGGGGDNVPALLT